MKLSEAIARRLEFDWESMRKAAIHERNRMGHEADSFADGAEAERARTASIDQLLIEAVEALEQAVKVSAKYSHGMDVFALNGMKGREVLAKLSKAVEAQ